jgi:hypothetical protein
MIIIVCTDDPGLTNIAQQSIVAHPGVFGNFYQIYTNPIPQIGAAENLFIIAHGAYNGDDNNPVIGDQANAFYVNAVELWENIQNIFPHGYQGNVYIDACESADNDAQTFSFAEVFLTQIQAMFGTTQVYGRNGTVGGQIPVPGDPTWVQAH